MHVDLQFARPQNIPPLDPKAFYETAMKANEIMAGALAHTLPDPEGSRIHFDGDDGSVNTVTFENLGEHRFALGALRVLGGDTLMFFTFILRFAALQKMLKELPKEYLPNPRSVEYEMFVVAALTRLKEKAEFDLQEFIQGLETFRNARK